MEVGLRIRWPFTILWTVVCVALVAGMVSTAAEPPPPGCWEYCSLNADEYKGLIPIAIVVWLVVTLVANCLCTLATTTRCPGCRRRIDRAVSPCPICSYDVRAVERAEAPQDRPAQPG